MVLVVARCAPARGLRQNPYHRPIDPSLRFRCNRGATWKRKTMNSLVQLTIDAHGGVERWQRFEHVSAHLRTGGVLWALKPQQGVLDDVNVRVALPREWASHSPFLKPNLRTSFEPHRVSIETTDGRVIEERLQPRDSFVGPRCGRRCLPQDEHHCQSQ